MSNEKSERPLAEASREEAAAELFPLTMSPEEYAGRHGSGWWMFSFDDYCYRNQELDVWIQRLGEILMTPGLVDHYQKQFCTPEEVAKRERRMAASQARRDRRARTENGRTLT